MNRIKSRRIKKKGGKTMFITWQFYRGFNRDWGGGYGQKKQQQKSRVSEGSAYSFD
jgi:hypothetical protein